MIRMGPVAALLADGDLRYLRVGGMELVRRIYGAVRDEAWGTVPAVVSQVDFREHASGWTSRFRAVHRRGAIGFEWDGTVDARVASIGGLVEVSVRYEMDGRAASSFLTSRTGLCLLHPIDGCAGLACRIEHSEGDVEILAFPDLISPHQPFLDLRAMSHEPVDGLHVEARFEGEVFETEDQRNWSDGSFKTYSRPISRGFPYRIEAGESVRQAITIRIKGRPPADDGRWSATVVPVRIGPSAGRLPPIGIAFGQMDETSLGLRSTADPGPSFLRVDWRECEGRIASLAGEPVEFGVPKEVGLHCSAGDPAGQVSHRPLAEVARWLLFEEGAPVATPSLARSARMALEAVTPGVPIGLGSEFHFTELNRNRPPSDSFDFLAYPVSPQCHAVDERSIVENLEALADQVRTARSFAGGKPIGVGPIRFQHPGSTEPDPRQSSAFAAAWLVGVLAELSAAGADWMSFDSGFESARGEDSAASRVLLLIRPFVGGEVLDADAADHLRIAVLALRNEGRLRILLANLTESEQVVDLDESVGSHSITYRIGEAGPSEPGEARTDGSIPLGPYQVVVLDGPASE